MLTVQGDDAALKKEHAALEGPWKIVSLESASGKDEKLEGAVLEFDKDAKSIAFMKDSLNRKGTYKINPAGKPKEIDLMPGDDNKRLEGIYEIDKDKLKLCIAEDTNDGRPIEFALKEGKRYVLIHLERAK